MMAAMNSNRNKVYQVISLSELKALVRHAEALADDSYGPTSPDRDNCCVILRGHLATGKNSRSKIDGARQIERLRTRTQAPELFNY